jgi:acetyl esterase/lipase
MIAARTNFDMPITEKPVKQQASGSTGSEVPNFIRSFFYRKYLPKGVDLKDPRISPFFAPVHSFPPSITIITCSGDKLSTEGNELADKLKAAGKDVVTYVAVGQGGCC